MNDDTKILGKLDEILRWMAAHDQKHEADDRDVKELRAEMYGNGHSGVKRTLDRLWQRCELRTCTSMWKRFAFSLLGKVMAGGILMFIGWLLWVYRNTPAAP